MPDGEHRVVYKAVADFAALYAEIAKARAALASLKAEEGKTGSGRNRGREVSNQRELTQATLAQRRATDDDNAAVQRQTQRYEQLSLVTRKYIKELSAAELQRREAARSDKQHAEAIDRDTAAVRRRTEAEGQLGLFSRRSVDFRRQEREARAQANRELEKERDLLQQTLEQRSRISRAGAVSQGRAISQDSTIPLVRGDQLAAVQELRREVAGRHRRAADEATGGRHRVTEEVQAGRHRRPEVTTDRSRDTDDISVVRLRSIRRETRGARAEFIQFGAGFALALRAGVRGARDAERGISRVRGALRGFQRAAASGGGGGGDNIFTHLAAGASGWANKITGGVGNVFRSFRRLLVIIGAVILVLGPAVALLGALGGAALGAGNALVSLSGSVLALPGLFTAAATGITALVLAIKPMMGVFQAYSAHQQAVAKSSATSASASQNAAHQVVTASHAYEQAARGVVEAQRGERQAQVALNEARQQAARDLQDIRAELNEANLDESEAVLAVKQAEADYRRALGDSNASQLDREQALNAVTRAEFDLRDVRIKNQRLLEDAAVAEKRGVEGNLSVVDARHAAQQATVAVADATFQLAEAARSLGQAQLEAASGGAQGLQTLNQLEDELSKLSPSAQTVARHLLGMADSFKELQRNVQESLFSPIVGQLGNLDKLLPVVNNLLTKSAAAMGNVAARGIEMISSGPWQADFATIADNNAVILSNLGNAGLSVADAFRNIIIAAGPFTSWLTEAIQGVAKSFADWSVRAREDRGIARFLEDTKDRMRRVWSVSKDLIAVFADLYSSSREFTTWQLDGLKAITHGWKKWSEKTKDPQSSFKKWLEDIKPLLSTAKEFVGAFSDAFTDMAKDPRNIAEAKKVLQLLSEKVLPALVGIAGELSASGALSSVVSLVGELLVAIQKFLAAGGTLPIEAFIKGILLVATAFFKILENKAAATVIVAVATAMGVLAAASVIGKFSGLFALIGGLRWLVLNAAALRALGLAGVLRGLALGTLGSTLGAGAGAAGGGAAAGAAGGAAGGALAGISIAAVAAIAVAVLATVASAYAIWWAAQGPGGNLHNTQAEREATRKYYDANKNEISYEEAKKLQELGQTVLTRVETTLWDNLSAIFTGENLKDLSKRPKDKIRRKSPDKVSITDDGRVIDPKNKDALGFKSSDWAEIFKIIKKDFILGVTPAEGEVFKQFYDSVLTPIGHFFATIGSYIWTSTTGAVGSFYSGVLTPIGHFFATIGSYIWTGTTGAVGSFYSGVLTPIGHFFVTIGSYVWAGVTGAVGSFYSGVLTPIGHFFATIGSYVWAGVTGAVGSFYSGVLTPIGHFFATIRGAIYDAFTSIPRWIGNIFSGGSSGNAPIAHHALGGLIEGPHNGRVDNLPILATAGEFMVRKSIMDKPGAKTLLREINEGRIDPASLYAALNVSAARVKLPENTLAARAATSTTINNANTRNAGLTVGDVTINNPVQERSDRSIRQTLQMLAFSSGR